MTVKIIKHGTSLLMPVPSDFRIQENAEYEPRIESNGALTFVPVRTNIYEENKNYDFRSAMKKMGIPDNGYPVEKEQILF
ncbi:hypothetical protein [Companilactobacillus ginsenosidimutans]|uniref:AbrB family transcriptional regulator n=1 Tax=Companilactobacillus ginsenosidimutans TaxID=1007676 RepID=A0A0H4QI21_9LACO|nr:hypothetical protein [Companilactobacillus ginsenosidimutans]AKP67587.1 hypothetical protein ABM34_08620 [Companilactobacillus ginsenosidimutans]